MGFWDFWKEEAKDYVHGWLDPAQTPGIAALTPKADGIFIATPLSQRLRLSQTPSVQPRLYRICRCCRSRHAGVHPI